MKNKLVPYLRYCINCGNRTKSSNIQLFYDNCDKYYYCNKCKLGCDRNVNDFSNGKPLFEVYISYYFMEENPRVICKISKKYLGKYVVYFDSKPFKVEALKDAFCLAKKLIKNKDLM